MLSAFIQTNTRSPDFNYHKEIIFNFVCVLCVSFCYAHVLVLDDDTQCDVIYVVKNKQDILWISVDVCKCNTLPYTQ